MQARKESIGSAKLSIAAIEEASKTATSELINFKKRGTIIYMNSKIDAVFEKHKKYSSLKPPEAMRTNSMACQRAPIQTILPSGREQFKTIEFPLSIFNRGRNSTLVTNTTGETNNS